MSGLPFSPSCEKNKTFILDVLAECFADRRAVLEIASGTGQHATCFAAGLAHLNWQPTELAENLAQLRPRCEAYQGTNLKSPLALDVRVRPWSLALPDAIFTANSLHIMALSAVEALFGALGSAAADTVLAVYGPFNYQGRYTSDSNARFDQWLAQQHPDSAIRDFETVNHLAAAAGFSLQHDTEMPANNRLLLWRKTA